MVLSRCRGAWLRDVAGAPAACGDGHEHSTGVSGVCMGDAVSALQEKWIGVLYGDSGSGQIAADPACLLQPSSVQSSSVSPAPVINVSTGAKIDNRSAGTSSLVCMHAGQMSGSGREGQRRCTEKR